VTVRSAIRLADNWRLRTLQQLTTLQNGSIAKVKRKNLRIHQQQINDAWNHANKTESKGWRNTITKEFIMHEVSSGN
jgi:hypothetical protein